MRGLVAAAAILLTLPVLSGLEAQTPESMPIGHQHTPGMRHPDGDSSFAAMQERGRRAMQVDQTMSIHHFDSLADGGRIVLESTLEDPIAIAGIRAHFKDIESAFRAGDFSIPMFVHDGPVPGTAVMAAEKDRIVYVRRELPRGAELRISTGDAAVVRAIHDFMAFQRTEHHAAGKVP